jgi:ParB-like chromosome segregation protein Spo0J
MIKIDSIRVNPDNPRVIDESKFEKLKRSLKEAPWMMKLRPIIIDEDGVILGGNMRYQALVANGVKELRDEWVMKAEQLTEEQKHEFIVKDNLGYGNWDFELLREQYDEKDLEDWGFELLSIGKEEEPGSGSGEGEGEGESDLIACPECGHKFVVVKKN